MLPSILVLIHFSFFQAIICLSQSEGASKIPTKHPTRYPTINPSFKPPSTKIKLPTLSPSRRPTILPSRNPSVFPSTAPSSQPLQNPIKSPSYMPTTNPTRFPSVSPSVAQPSRPSSTPTLAPSYPTVNPSGLPSQNPAKIFVDSTGNYSVVGRTGIPAVHMFVVSLTKVHIVNRLETGFPIGMLPEDSSGWTTEYDLTSNTYRLLAVSSNQPGCGTGSYLSSGIFWMTGGGHTLRYYDGTTWHDEADSTVTQRWYGTSVTMPAGNILFVGGQLTNDYHSQYLNPTYEFYPNPNKVQTHSTLLDQTDLPDCCKTTYPFVFVLPDGYVLLMVNTHATVWDPINNLVIKSLPDAPSAFYKSDPLTAGFIALPLSASNSYWPIIMACGGGDQAAWTGGNVAAYAGKYCATLNTQGYMTQTLKWVSEEMPSPRVMVDMINLPNGKVLILNGAQQGQAGYPFPVGVYHASNPNKEAVLYDPSAPAGSRFKTYGATSIARMYHSTAILTYDGSVLVAGSSTERPMSFTGPYPTEFRAEKFYPAYMTAAVRPVIVNVSSTTPTYGSTITVTIDHAADASGFVGYFIHPGLSTHGQMMGARSVILAAKIAGHNSTLTTLQVTMPPNANVAPPMGLHYYLFITRTDTLIPSKAIMMSVQ